MIKPKHDSTQKRNKDLLISKTKSFKTLIKQTNTKPQETFEIKLTQSRETLSFKPPITIEGS